MKAETKVNIVLELNEAEAGWLKSLMQNPIGFEYEDELHGDREMRKKFWEALGGNVVVGLQYPEGVRGLNIF